MKKYFNFKYLKINFLLIKNFKSVQIENRIFNLHTFLKKIIINLPNQQSYAQH
mgnify:CR=1 FL=1